MVYTRAPPSSPFGALPLSLSRQPEKAVVASRTQSAEASAEVSSAEVSSEVTSETSSPEISSLAEPNATSELQTLWEGPFGLKLSANRTAESAGAPMPMAIADAALGSALKRMGALEDPRKGKLSDAQLALLRESVFGADSFFVRDVERSYLGAIFRGNLQRDPAEAFATVEGRLESERALDGVSLLLLNDPVPLTLAQLQAGEERSPVFLALASPTRMSQPIGLLLASIATLLFTAFTTLGFALSSFLLSGKEGELIEMLQVGNRTPSAPPLTTAHAHPLCPPTPTPNPAPKSTHYSLLTTH